MSKEYIEREALLEEINDAISNMIFVSPYQDEIDSITNGAEQIRDMVAEALTADVEPVRHGEWKLLKDGNGICSYCGHWQTKVWCCDNAQRYCGVCGAKMDGGNK